MPKSANQKLKLLYLMDILLERTDEAHGISMQEILDALKAHGITAERKSIYDDFESLRTYGQAPPAAQSQSRGLRRGRCGCGWCEYTRPL